MNLIGFPRTEEARPAAAQPARRNYRPDIDGLRAIAVIAVVLTHAGIPGCAGGFIGVDVFFVISGYLIVRNLESAQEGGLRGIGKFYARRLRRTMPALYLAAGVTFLAGCAILMPGDLDDLARSLIASLCLVPNIYFLTQVGYFDHGAMSKPLLHTWSLGVEEQFYLLAPLLPLVLRRLDPRGRKIAFVMLFAAGLVFCVLLQAKAPAAAFYLMPARLWEFFIGSLVAEKLVPPLRNRWLAEIVSAVSLIALIATIVLLSPESAHPGLVTLIPCAATAALIHAGSHGTTTFAGRLVGNRLFVAVGLISYSLYLWHWPLIVYLRYAGVDMTWGLRIAAFAALIAVSALSWRFVEVPFRTDGSPLRRHAARILPAAAAILVAVSLAVSLDRGWPARFPAAVASIARFYDYREAKPYREGQCFITSRETLAQFDRGTCLNIDPKRKNILLLGDSHAAHFWTALQQARPDDNILQATASGCKPLLGTTGEHRCEAMMAEMFQSFLPAHRLDGVIISALWRGEDLAALKATIAYLKPLVGEITVLGPTPVYDEPMATLLARSVLHGDLASMKAHEYADVPLLDAEMRGEIAPLATYVSAYQAMCPAGACRLFAAPGVPMLFDFSHLTNEGAAVLVQRLLAAQALHL
mgnify:CR=1 FL=1